MAGLAQLSLYAGDAVARTDAATVAAPAFAMGHVLGAWLILLRTEAPTHGWRLKTGRLRRWKLAISPRQDER